MVSRSLALVATLLSLGSVHAGPFQPMMPRATPFGLAAEMGMSPMPTDPPGMPRNIPRELIRRQSANFDDLEIPYPPAGYYCGLVDGDPEIPLTCNNAEANCVYQGNYAGCCLSSEISDCTELPTACVNWADKCDDDCKKDTHMLQCTVTTRPYCGQYVLAGSTTLLGCYSVTSVTGNVSPLSEYYSSVLGSGFESLYSEPTVATTPTPTSTSDDDDEDDEETGTETSSEPTGTETDSPGDAEPGGEGEGDNEGDGDSENQEDGGDEDGSDSGSGGKKKKGISGGAIAGIVIGVVAGIGLIAFAIWWFVMKKGKDKAGAAPAPSAQQPPYAPVPQDATGAAASYYAHDAKDSPDQQQGMSPAYLKAQDPSRQSYQSNAAEMPGSVGPRGSTYNPSELGSSPTSPSVNSPSVNAAGLSPNNAGPVPEQIHEIGPSR